jgi:L-histidine Nalpha-methyltransferase
MPVTEPIIDVHLAVDAWHDELADAARRSLADDPPWLDPVWFYDERGSALFDTITRLPEYYLTRAERALLAAHAHEIAELGLDTLIELGSGTSDKTRLLVDAMTATGRLRRYVPFDVSEETLRIAMAALADRYPAVQVHGVVGDFHRHLDRLPREGRRMVAFLGSTIGNLRPEARQRFLVDLDSALDHDDRLLLGIDLVKEPARLVAAYDDAGGVTAEFNRNCLRVLNRALGCDFDPGGFEHVARWCAEDAWVEIGLRSRWDQTVLVPGLSTPLSFPSGAELRTEISAKFTVESMTGDLEACGFVVERTWVAGADEFALLLARPWC